MASANSAATRAPRTAPVHRVPPARRASARHDASRPPSTAATGETLTTRPLTAPSATATTTARKSNAIS